MSKLFSQTQRETPSEAEIASHVLLLRAGYIRQLAAGVFSYLPLARRSMDKIESILHEEMQAIGGQAMTMPVVHPAALWQESGRWYSIDAEMGRFKDRNNRDMVLAMTHEEVVADLARSLVRTRRQLPMLVYHIQTKWRDDPRPRAGLIRVREFTMKDSYSLDADWEGLEAQYQAHYQAYERIFERCGIPVRAVAADTGMMGGKVSHEFMYLTPVGEDTLVLCDSCGYAANRQVARLMKPEPPAEEAAPLEKVATPDCKTIAELAEYLGIPKSRTAKAVFLVATLQKEEEKVEEFIFAIVRGDMDLNETKLANATKALSLRPATEAEILAVGAEPGYASPIGLEGKTWNGLPVRVVVDDLIPKSKNLVAGANEAGYHLRNTNYGRDYAASAVDASATATDLTIANDGDPCVECGNPLHTERAVEVGNIFQLGDRYSKAFGCTYTDTDGKEKPILMGSYGIGVGRLLACIAEEHHDEYGLRWPASVAPFDVHLVVLPGKKGAGEVEAAAEELYRELEEAGIDVLYDDRPESPGVKFNDADLIGIPLRLTVSERNFANQQVEVKRRSENEREMVGMEEAVGFVREELSS